MTPEAAAVYCSAIDAMSVILSGLVDWADMLEGSERNETLYHVGRIMDAYRTLNLAVADYERIEL